MSYNYLNLPYQADFNTSNAQPANNLIEWKYDAAGMKLQKYVTENSSQSVQKEYCNGIEYNNGSLEAIYFSEGRLVPDGAGWTYEYTLTDHLGNNRVTFRNNNGVAETIDENHYYPFGMLIEDLTMRTNTTANDYLYNGKELDSELGLELQHYGARLYDGAWGRFTGVDPIADQFTWWAPYSYSFDNPIRFIDPDGRAPSDIILQGANNSSITIKTDLIDIEVDASSVIGDVEGNHTLEGDPIVEAGLDIVGTVDPTPVTDGIAAAYYAAKGEYGNATISTLGIVPLLGDAAKLFRAGKHAKTLRKAIDCLTCFSDGTLVLTSEGPKTIEEVQVGDMVWAYDEVTGDVALKEVLLTHNLVRDSLFEIHLNTGDVIEATPNHPFFVHGTWFQVRDLSVGDTLTTYAAEDDLIIVESLILRKGEFRVYNFTVEDYHTYYVGQGAILVHNCGVKKRNTSLAGKKHPTTDVPFDDDGFPDFSGNLYKDGNNDVNIGEFSGDRTKDKRKANKAAGYKETPEGYVWHHHQENGRMQLVKASAHKKTGHTGGHSIHKKK